MVIATVGQAALLMGALPDTLLIRRYQDARMPAERRELFGTVVKARGAIAWGLTLVAVVVWLLGLVPRQLLFPGVMGLALLHIRAFMPQWAYQAAEKMRHFGWMELAMAVGTLLLYALFMRPGARVGSDLAVQTAVAAPTAALMLYYANRVIFAGGSHRSPRYPASWGLAVRLLRDGRWLVAMQAMVYVYVGLEVALVGYFSGVTAAGQYRTAMAWIQLANLLLVIPPIILFPRFVEWRNVSPAFLWEKQKRLGKLAAAVALAGMGVAVLVVPAVHTRWFGAAYADAVWPAVILLSSKMLILVNSVWGWGVMANARMDKSMAVLTAVIAIFSLSANCLLIPSFGLMAAASVNFASELAAVFGTYHLAKVSARGLDA